MTRLRELPPMVNSAVGEGGQKLCHMMTGVDISTVQIQEGHFVCLTLSRPDLANGACLLIDHDELGQMIATLLNAAEDAELLDSGRAPIHTTGLAVTTPRH